MGISLPDKAPTNFVYSKKESIVDVIVELAHWPGLLLARLSWTFSPPRANEPVA